MTNAECWVLSKDNCARCPCKGGKPGCVRLTADRISEAGMERLHNAKMAQAIKDYMKGFKYTRCRKEPKKPIPRREPTGVLSPKELWRYRYSMARFKRRFEAFKRWHNCKRQMDDAERYFRSEEFAAETGYRYKPDEIIERMKRKIRHMTYKNIEEGTNV